MRPPGAHGARLLQYGIGVMDGGGGGGAPAYDADAETLFAAMSVEPDDTRKGLINTAIVDLKAAGVWDELDELWFFAAHAEQAGLLGWKRYKDCLAVNAPTFTTDRGFAGDGTTSYLNTQFVPSTDGVNFTQNDASMMCYVRVGQAADRSDMGCYDGTRWALIKGNNTTLRINLNATANQNTGTMSAIINLRGTRRASSTHIQGWVNGSQLGSDVAQASAGLSSRSIFIGGYNNGTPAELSTRQYSAACLGAAMTTQQQADLFDIVEAFLDAIGAGVVA